MPKAVANGHGDDLDEQPSPTEAAADKQQGATRGASSVLEQVQCMQPGPLTAADCPPGC